MLVNRTINPCPRCKNGLRLIVESENKSESAFIKYSYVCDACRYRKIVENIIIKMNSDKVIIFKKTSNNLS